MYEMHDKIVDESDKQPALDGACACWGALTTEQKVTKVAAGLMLLALLHGPVVAAFKVLRDSVLRSLRTSLDT